MSKVYFILGAIPPQTGGEIYNYKILKYLEAEGFETECISLHKTIPARLSRIPLIGVVLANIVVLFWFCRYKGILVEDHYFTKYLLLTNIIHRFLNRGKIIILVHSLYGYDTSDNFFLRKWFNGINHKIRLCIANIIVTNSEYSKKEMIAFGIDDKLINVIPPGLDRSKFKIINQNNQKESNIILCVANYLPGKGLIYLLEAFSQINKKGFTLHLVGNPQKRFSYFQKIETTVQKLNLSKNVYLHNGTDKNKLYQLYSQANIFVLPTLKETFGMVLIEAMHYGLPIITTNVGAIPELVTDKYNGFLVTPANSNALAEALSKLIDNPELRKKMGNRCQLRVANSYYWEQTCSQFKFILQNMK